MRSLRIYSQLSHITCSSVNYTYHVIHCIPSTYLSYNWKFVPFDHLHPIPPPPRPASGNHRSDLFFYEFVNFYKVSLSGFGIRLMLALQNEFRSIPSSANLFLKQFKKNRCYINNIFLIISCLIRNDLKLLVEIQLIQGSFLNIKIGVIK